jgi:diguanylate cyclase (GGDEF)-like protein
MAFSSAPHPGPGPGDTLNLPNRGQFLGPLQELLRRISPGTAVGVFCVQVNRLREIQDCFGWWAGEAVLSQVGRRLSEAVGPFDVVGRLNPDEFIVVLPGLAAPDALSVAARLTAAITSASLIDGRQVAVGASTGVVIARSDEPKPEDLLEWAAIASHRASERGAGQVAMFEPVMRDSAQAQLRGESELRRALDEHELSVWYQPIVSLPGGRLVGAEALARLARPDHGMVPAAQVIATAERSGLISELGRAVLQAACRQASTWGGLVNQQEMTISVNVSGLQLADPSFPDQVLESLAACALEPASLCLELTESVLTHRAPVALAALERLRAAGVTLALDDFGTGFSSLACLREFPIQALKVDRSFVAGVGQDAADTAIVRSSIDLAHALGLTAIAEGVETLEQLDHLLSMGCDRAQGYLWSPAVPAAEFRQAHRYGRGTARD